MTILIEKIIAMQAFSKEEFEANYNPNTGKPLAVDNQVPQDEIPLDDTNFLLTECLSLLIANSECVNCNLIADIF